MAQLPGHPRLHDLSLEITLLVKVVPRSIIRYDRTETVPKAKHTAA